MDFPVQQTHLSGLQPVPMPILIPYLEFYLFIVMLKVLIKFNIHDKEKISHQISVFVSSVINFPFPLRSKAMLSVVS